MRRSGLGVVRRCKASIAVVVFAGLLALPSSAAALTDFTWSGAMPFGAGAANWSNTTNWVGGAAPSGSVGTLTFPNLGSNSACAGAAPTETCGRSNNDIGGLSVSALSIDDGGAWAGGLGYQISGNGITLGAGGITAAPASGDTGFNGALIDLPITLGANQTWSITGGSNGQGLAIGANVTAARTRSRSPSAARRPCRLAATLRAMSRSARSRSPAAAVLQLWRSWTGR